MGFSTMHCLDKLMLVVRRRRDFDSPLLKKLGIDQLNLSGSYSNEYFLGYSTIS
jgi:hypothetical protein